MQVTVCVQLDPSEQVPGQPTSATVTYTSSGWVADLLERSRVEAANPHMPAGWRDCTPAVVAGRIIAAGLRVSVGTVVNVATPTQSEHRLTQ